MKRAVPALLLLGGLAPLHAATVPSGSAVQDKAFRDPGLYIPSLEKPLAELDPGLAAGLQQQLPALGVPPDNGYYDWRAGRWGSLVPSVPLVPGDGVGNGLVSVGGDLKDQVRQALSAYLAGHRDELRVDPAQLGEARIDVFEGGNLIQVHVPRVVGGIPVRDSGLSAVINHGNLVLLGLQQWGDVDDVGAATVDRDEARGAVERHLDPFRVEAYRSEGHLELIPTARGEDLATTPAGAGYDFRLAWVLAPDVEGDAGSWEAVVDARSGELIQLHDLNQYAVRRAMGGVYPVSNDQRPPDGVEQANWPMPFANLTGGLFTNAAGMFPGCVAGGVATSLNGTFVRMLDVCGAINETGAGDINLGTSGGTDCAVPAGHSAGDTHSSRSGFYELNRIKEQARGYLPGNAWLNAQLTANMNINDSCNAFWGGGTVNFYRSSAQCGNTGEIAAIFDHEWGHGLDDNGTNGNISSPGEAIADINAILRLKNSCVGRGFLRTSVCGGYGDQCDGTTATGCTGVRDSDWMLHRCNRPHGISWILNGFTSAQCNGTGAAPACPGGGQTGPCNRETHCEGQIAAEVGWDLHFRDLQAAPFSFDSNTALELTTRLMFLGPQTLTNWYSCAGGCAAAGTCGCGATGGYLLTLAADDDNGSIADGTPHMSAIRAAFERHEIHCATQTVTNSGCAAGPTAAPVVTATAAPGAVNLSWGAVAGATHYFVYRTEGVFACDFGKVKIADVAGTSFSDTGLLDGRSYSYGVLPVGSNNACFGRMSACASATPTVPNDPCATVVVQFAATASTVAESGNAPVVVTLTTQNAQPTTGTVMVNFATANGTATAGADYTATSGTLTFPVGTPNGGTQTINVPILADALDEADETFTLTLSGPVGASVGTNSTHTVTITDDDAAPALAISDVTLVEGNAGTTSAVFTVTLSPVSGQAVTASFATANGTAGAGSDYVAASGGLSFAPGTTTQAVSVTVNGDLLDEPDETFFVNLANATNATLSDDQGLGTISDDDGPAALSIGDVTVTEGNAGTVNAAFTVTLSPVSGQTVTLSFATADGTATAGSDYASASGSLTFAPGTTAQAVSVAVNGDVLDEPNETFVVDVTNPTNATVSDGQGIGTITDDDAPSTLTIDDVTLAEGDAGTTLATFALTLTPVSGQTVTLDFSTADGTATAGSDYVAASGSLTFAPGATTQALSVTVNGDGLVEPDETFLVDVANAVNAAVGDGQGLGTISNDDATVSITIADASVVEGNGGTSVASFVLSLSAQSAQAVTVDFATADGTANAGSDYVSASGSLTFAPGSTGETIDVTVNGDVLDEPDETFFVDLTNPGNGTVGDAQGLGTIGDDDAAPFLTVADTSVREGTNGTSGPATFTVSLDAPSGQTVTVGFATSDGTAGAGTDYVAAAGALTFSPGVTAGSLAVTVNGDDLLEADETFFVDLTGPTNAGVADGQGLGAIANDDSWPELSHGQALVANLRAQPGPTPDLDVYQLSQKPVSSYEAVLDATSGDLGPSGPTLERIASDGITVLQGSQPAGSGSSRSLRWENVGAGAVLDQTLRVNAPSCSATCGPEDVYRIRLLDTTASIPRFNNSATQATILVLQALGSDAVAGTIRFWGPTGTLLASQPFTLSSHGALVLNTAGVAGVGGQSGSITIASDAAYGALAGKAVAVEPATGFTFDTYLAFRPR